MESTRKLHASLAFVAAIFTLFISACNQAETGQLTQSNGAPSVLPDTSAQDPANPPVTEAPSYSTEVLLFNGIGISTSDWQTTEQIVKNAGLSYRLVNSTQLNAMSIDEMASFGMMLFPGGYGNQITNGLTAATRIRVRQAVRERGVSFLGICAGAWVTVGPEPAAGTAASYGFAIVTGKILSLHLPGGYEPTAAMVDVSFANGAKRHLVWWGGPETPEWQSGVVARYVNGKPAISQTWAGKGFVVVTGPHPEAPLDWRSTAGNDRDGLDYDIALDLILAALKRQPLPAF